MSKRYTSFTAPLEVRAEGDYRPGIAGVVQGIALRYGVVDSYGTMFAPESASRTIAERVTARKVNVFMDHDAATARHVGVVAMARDIGDSLVVDLELFDTAAGREALEYVRAVLAADAQTGLSIGFVPRTWKERGYEGQQVIEFTEIELREVSLTPVPAVPGAMVTGTRAEDNDDTQALLVRAIRASLAALSPETRAAIVADLQTPTTTDTAHADAHPAPDTPDADAVVTYADMACRVHAARSTFATPT